MTFHGVGMDYGFFLELHNVRQVQKLQNIVVLEEDDYEGK